MAQRLGLSSIFRVQSKLLGIETLGIGINPESVSAAPARVKNECRPKTNYACTSGVTDAPINNSVGALIQESLCQKLVAPLLRRFRRACSSTAKRVNSSHTGWRTAGGEGVSSTGNAAKSASVRRSARLCFGFTRTARALSEPVVAVVLVASGR